MGTEAQPWPPNWLVIAKDGGGDHWYIDLAAKPATAGLVWKLEHDSGRRYMAAPSLDGWVKHLRALF